MSKNTHNKEKFGLKELIAIGVGGMIGGGIFSVLGLAVDISGHAAPIAFGVGSVIALAAGYSYIKLALTYHNDGASFTYLERAFPNQPNVAGIAGWTIIVGYIGTLALYAFTFGAYGADLFGQAGSGIVRMFLSLSVLLFFMLVNLYGVKASGETEDIVVYTKIILLTIFAVIGLFFVKGEFILPLVNKGASSIFLGGALIFVAYEGFQLITNAVCETENPERNVPRGIYGSIIITSIIYVVIAVVGVGNLSPQAFHAAKEYALAAAAEPILGNAGRVLIAVAALLATSSAINGTVFGASRMMAEMATQEKMPAAFSLRNRTKVPWLAVVILTVLASMFTLVNGLEMIASFSSMTFLLVSVGVSIANLRLRKKTKSKLALILLGLILMLTTIVLLVVYLWSHSRNTLVWIVFFYVAVMIMEFIFSKRNIFRKKLK
ncbi:MAG TPA: amino acid permease [Caldithrix abyssi]|uniref:Amino acid permease n=1 Tax=Caldithrix abyssi TaxID=187145 RepID=A0A7V4WVZ6_CALAY|nr:amino acid permease [Caldithrix abyssi]